MWIVGSGRNGKGVWQRTMEAILSLENVSNLSLEEFDGNHRFALYQLYGKLFNPCSEPRANKELQTNLLKYATGQDTIEAERKGAQQRLKYKNAAKITVLANKFPRVNDQTTAFKERRLFLKFPNEFTGNNQIQNLEQIWINNPAEMSGILNWMLKGLQRLFSQGYFTESKTQQETETEFLRHSDTISAFITEQGTFDKNFVTLRSEAIESYKTYCDFYGLECESEKKFTQRLKDTPKIGVCQVRSERAWKGISFKKLEDDKEPGEAETQTTLPNTANTQNTRGHIPSNLQNQKIRESTIRVCSVFPVLAEESKTVMSRVCGDCSKYGLPCCSYPGDFSKLPKDHWAGECVGFSVEPQVLPSFEDKCEPKEAS
jgi:P4 family phage/plasmid primase-like protien